MNTNGVQLVDVVDLNSAYGIRMFVLNLAIAGVHVHFPHVYVIWDEDKYMDVSTGRVYSLSELTERVHNPEIVDKNANYVQVWIDAFNSINEDMQIKPFPLELQ